MITMKAKRISNKSRAHKGLARSQYLKTSEEISKLLPISSYDWTYKEEEHLLDLFKRMSVDVPAYRDFLNQNNLDVKSIKTSKDFKKVPITSKKNYFHKNQFSKLAWNGILQTPHVLTATSGSTGKPTYFARSYEVDKRATYIHELILRTSSLSHDKSTLVIVCFGMGIWIGGIITYQAFKSIGQSGYPVAIITPGINKKEIMRALTEIAPQYEQLVLTGYPPFIKDIVDSAIDEGVSFSKYHMAFIFAAEAFTETFRDYIADKVGLKNRLTDAINIYGSADIGTMAFETPISILVRRIASKNEKLFKDLFNGVSKTPTLTQYIPNNVSFESVDGEIFISGDSMFPLFRYSIGDRGGVYSFQEIVDLFNNHGIDLLDEADLAGIKQSVFELPFVYVYERIDFATTLYGLQIYPETIKEVLLQPQFNEHVTGRLTLITKYNENQDQYLEVNIELKKNEKKSKRLETKIKNAIIKNLNENNSEFNELLKFVGERAKPVIVFWDYEDSKYFKTGIKQKWVVKET